MGAPVGRLALWGAVLPLLIAADARAGSIVVIGNYPQANDGTLSAVTSLDGNYAKAVGFTMGAQSYELASATLRLMEQAGSTSTLSMALYGGTAAGPSGPALVNFNTPSIPNLVGNVTFTPTSTQVLQAHSTYWLEVSGQSNTLDGIVWYASAPTVTPTGPASSLGAFFTTHLSAQSLLQPSSVTNTFQITASDIVIADVPEPSGLVQIGCAALVGLIYACRRLIPGK
jgi:hypothetical protein